jgi:hypothetical protein
MNAVTKHISMYGELQIIPVTLFLFDDARKVGAGLARYYDIVDDMVIFFQPLFICLKSISRAEIAALGDLRLWPLMMLAKEKLHDILISQMFRELKDHHLHDIVPIAHAAASWTLKKRKQYDLLAWLEMEYGMLKNLYQEIPALEWFTRDVRAEEQEKARLREEALEKHLAKQAQKREEALAKKALVEKEALTKKAQVEKEKELLSTFRQMLVDTIDVRFPSLLRLARKAVKITTSHDELRQVHRQLMIAPDVASAENLLYALGEERETA